MNITKNSLNLFLALANDAGNWGGNPLLGGNIVITKEERGNLTQLKQAGLLTTFLEDGDTWVNFTNEGKGLAAAHGIEI